MGASQARLLHEVPYFDDPSFTSRFQSYIHMFGEEELEWALQQQLAEPAAGSVLSGVLPWHTVKPRFTYYIEDKKAARDTYKNTVAAIGVLKVHNQPAFPCSELFAPARAYTVRVSHGTLGGNDAAVGIRGMSIKFLESGAVSPLDLLLTTGNAAPFYNAATYAELSYLGIDVTTASGTPNAEGGGEDDDEDFGDDDNIPLEQFCRRNPLSYNALCSAMRFPPPSYASLHYYCHTTYTYVANDMRRWHVRFRVIPADRRSEDPTKVTAPWRRRPVNPQDTKSPDYLRWEFQDQLRVGPIEYLLQMQVRDITGVHGSEVEQNGFAMNASIPWTSEMTPWVDIGLMTLDDILEEPDASNNLFYSSANYPACCFVKPYYSINDYTTHHHIRSYYHATPNVPHAGLRKIRVFDGEGGGLVTYRVRLFVGGRRGRGEQARVTVRLLGEGGKSAPQRLAFWSQNRFATMKGDEFIIHTQEELDPLCMLTFNVRAQGLFTRWYVKRIEIKNVATGSAFNFVMGKWIDEGETTFFESSCILLHCEQDVTTKEHRMSFTHQQKKIYQWSDNTPRPWPLHLYLQNDVLPLAERGGERERDWPVLLRHASKHLAVPLDGYGFKRPSDLASYLQLLHLTAESNHLLLQPQQQQQQQQQPQPWESDAVFTQMFQTGPFAHMLTRLRNVPQAWQSFLLSGKADKSQLYYVDLYALEGLPCQSGRIVYPAMIVFIAHPNSARLELAMIQLTIVGGPKLFTPHQSTPNDWLLAKAHAACATAHVHVLGHTLVQCYFGIEPFVVALRRNLPDCHPIAKVLAPHIEGHLGCCAAIRKQLLGPKGEFSDVFALTPEGINTLVERVYTKWCLTRDNTHPEMVASRGVEVPLFPHRDDGILLWNALDRYVGSMLEMWYVSSEDVVSDTELLNFLDDLTVSGLKGRAVDVLGARRPFSSLEDVISLVATLIWSVTVMPSVLMNNSQMWDAASIVPLVPLSMHRSSTFEKATMGVLLESFPPIDIAARQVCFMRAWTQPTVCDLQSAMTNRDLSGQPTPAPGFVLPLGYADQDLFFHEAPTRVAQSFQQTLLRISQEVTTAAYNPFNIACRLVR